MRIKKYQKNTLLILLLNLLQFMPANETLTEDEVISTIYKSTSSVSDLKSIIHTEYNKIRITKVMDLPSTTKTITISQSPSDEELYLTQSDSYVFACNSKGNVFVLNKLYDLRLIKSIKLPVSGISTFPRNQIHYFKDTNYIFVSSRDIYNKTCMYGDFTKRDEDFHFLENNNNVIRFSSFISNEMILSVENYVGKMIMKFKLNVFPAVLFSTYTSSFEVLAMANLEKSSQDLKTKFLQLVYTGNFYRLQIYDSFNNGIDIQKDLDFVAREFLDICIIDNIDFFVMSSKNPEKMTWGKLSDLNYNALDYGNGELFEPLKNIMRTITYVKNTDLIWTGKDRDLQLFKMEPPICQNGCTTCSKTTPGYCDDCGSNILLEGFCISSSCPPENPYYYVETNECKSSEEAGYYCINYLCRKCPLRCASCSDSFSCNTCDLGLKNDAAISCQLKCSDGYFAAPPTYNGCEKCTENCRECNGPNIINCVQCYGLTPSGGTECSNPCKDDEFFDVSSMSCGKCDENCVGCVGPSNFNCKSCKEKVYSTKRESVPDLKICSDECSLGKFPNNSTWECEDCKSGCKSCLDLTRCQECEEDFFDYEGVCLKICPLGYTNSGDKCIQCFENCVICTNTTICTRCVDGYEVIAEGEICKKKGINSIEISGQISYEKRRIGQILALGIFLIAGLIGFIIKWYYKSHNEVNRKEKEKEEKTNNEKKIEETERKELNKGEHNEKNDNESEEEKEEGEVEDIMVKDPSISIDDDISKLFLFFLNFF